MKANYILITGASQGLGKAISFELAKRKWNLVLVALPDSGLKNLAVYLKKVYGTSVLTVETDLSSGAGCDKVINFINKRGIQLNYLINNAGVLSRGLFKDQKVGYFMKQINVNVMAPTYLIRELIGNLKDNSPSGILNVSSMASFFPLPLKQVYCGTKSFLSIFSRSLRMELKNEGVSVSLLCPGGINTTTRICMQNRSLGWLDRKSVLDPDQVARIAVKGMIEGKEIIIPGVVNRFLIILSKLIPPNLRFALIMKEMDRLKRINEFMAFNHQPQTAL